jgi:hypothetical protein
MPLYLACPLTYSVYCLCYTRHSEVWRCLQHNVYLHRRASWYYSKEEIIGCQRVEPVE